MEALNPIQKAKKELSDRCFVLGWDSENNEWLKNIQTGNVFKSYEKLMEQYKLKNEEIIEIMYDSFRKNNSLIFRGEGIQKIFGNRNGIFGFLELAENYQKSIENKILETNLSLKREELDKRYNLVGNVIEYIKMDNDIDF